VTGQRGPSGKRVRRALLALATTAAAALLLAPTAAASPESDADQAITAAWEAAGGENSVLGAKRGDVYAVGDGFAQNFAGGKMFFTPATGAKSMYGAILDKYESLGGPASSDLGFPTINEVPGLVGPDSRVSTFSASDKPVIFFTPDHGAFVVRGAMNAAWDKLGSSGGVLGVPVGDETYDGELATQPFSGGKVSWNRVTKTFATVPPELAGQLTGLQVPTDPTATINTAWRATGGVGGPLGAKQGGQYPLGKDAIVQDFTDGKVFFSPTTGANAVEGDILGKYESLGGPIGSDLGFPTANETDGGISPTSRISTFSAPDKPVIFWTPVHGAFVVRGAMKAAWDKLGGPTGKLGAPVSDQAVDGKLVTQKFAGGTISWDRAKNTFSSEPSNLASSLSGLQVPGQNSPSRSATAAGANNGLTRHWWWLLVAIAVLVLMGMVALVALRWRRRRTVRPDATVGLADRDVDIGYGAADGLWSPDAGSSLGPVPVQPGYPEPPGHPLTMGAPDQPAQSVSWMLEADGAADLAEGASIGAAPAVDAGPGIGEYVDVDDPDAVDTAPTRVPSAFEVSTGRHAAIDTAEYAAAQSDTGQPGQLAIHLPLDDPYQMPDGYPIKANVHFGLYYTPDNAQYEYTLAEIWLASEEAARANGFTKAR
jgi:uncharacterized protein with LGFP repeats